ncbi:hypothetical protein SCATT_14020 [Streptantibioticus cattleyicolor NRRL 8057 = DSM 46488]|uniref:Uncharacterized protein n=1 Tax=Streptantibioticus cattleyicolor (strain ATCC 35852 / DSM 46488 / JCM 4925 / NBRC 14057 / NRRL 8057) TaxID=1003195 RepID=G8WWB7_STREN|nr:hypothetical protein SCATT_14020 [Streptantibioticus cattleyicolor NRRL 8057 = DSM 46488]
MSRRPAKVRRREIVEDLRTGEVGELMDMYMGLCFVRPLHGGREWSVAPEFVRRLGSADLLRVRRADRERARRGADAG